MAVWYVSYGSNPHADRFACYLRGGTPPGASRPAGGCRDPRAARATRPIPLPHALWFGGRSPVWGGGTAHLDTDTPGETLGRGWLVTVDQFSDILAQENGLAAGAIDLDEALLADGGIVVHDRRYGRLVPPPSMAATGPNCHLTPIGPARGARSQWTRNPCTRAEWPMSRDEAPGPLAPVAAVLLM